MIGTAYVSLQQEDGRKDESSRRLVLDRRKLYPLLLWSFVIVTLLALAAFAAITISNTFDPSIESNRLLYTVEANVDYYEGDLGVRRRRDVQVIPSGFEQNEEKESVTQRQTPKIRKEFTEKRERNVGNTENSKQNVKKLKSKVRMRRSAEPEARANDEIRNDTKVKQETLDDAEELLEEEARQLGLDTAGRNEITRLKREVTDKLKQETENAIVRLMQEPACREDCKRLEKKLLRVGESIDHTLNQLFYLKEEIDELSKDCLNRTKAEDTDESDELELPLSRNKATKVRGDELEDRESQRDEDAVVDHDLAGSSISETHQHPPIEPAVDWGTSWPPDQDEQHLRGYPWPAAESSESDAKSRVPPTGPDSSVLEESAVTGPGEAVQTSQQMTVALPQHLQKICTTVPGPPGSSAYLCSPVHNLLSSQQSPTGNFYLQVVGQRSGSGGGGQQSYVPAIHVPTAISSPNPYAFPTLSGSPVIVPASAASQSQLLPVYNPSDGRIFIQNYPQSVPAYTQSQQHQATQLPYVIPPQSQPSAVPAQQYTLPQFPQQPGQYQYPKPIQYIAAQQPGTVQYVPSPQPVYYQQPPQYYVPQVLKQPQLYYPQLSQPVQQQVSPVLVPGYPQHQVASGDPVQCSYVIVPNSPIQTYKFPPVAGVSETLAQRSEEDYSKSNDDKINKNKGTPEKLNLHVGTENVNKGHKGNNTSPKMNIYGEGCAPGMRSCADGKGCVEMDSWCDSKIDCFDFSDEQLCSCKDRILPEKYCDGYFDCPEGEDELGCSGCSEDMFSCDNSSPEDGPGECLPMEKRCDMVRDCRNGKDEVDCNLISDTRHVQQVSIVSYSEGFLFRNWRGMWYPVCNSPHWPLEACKAEFGVLTGVPETKYGTLEDYRGLVASQTGPGVELAHACPGFPPGTALWVTCSDPECGIKPGKKALKRKKREQPPPPPEIASYQHVEEPQFQSTPEAMEFVKNFFNSASVLDRRQFYKRLWGPLVQPYMGVHEDPTPSPPGTNLEEDGIKDQATVQRTSDPSQESWKMYLRPYHQTIESFDPNYYFPNYQEAVNYGRLHSNDFLPAEGYNYRTYPEKYLQNYNNEPYVKYIRRLREIEEERLKREETLRVVGGSRSEPGEWPWLVVLYRDGEFHCGGTILTPYLILTAAHCVDQFTNHYYEVQAGVLRRLSFSPQEQIRKVDRVMMHEEYDKSTMTNDVALMKLNSPLKFNRWVLPACLPPTQQPGMPSFPEPGTMCTAIGWGAVYEHGPDPDHLREVEVPILPTCTHRVDRLGNEICAGYPEGGMDTCQGDSGGPLLCRMKSNKWYIAGIVSHGEGCGRLGEPGVYTRVSLYKPWIQEKLISVWPRESEKSSMKTCPGPTCRSGRCLPEGTRCDSHVDCLFAEDEKGCSQLDPLPGQRSVGGDAVPTNGSRLYVHTTIATITNSTPEVEVAPKPVTLSETEGTSLATSEEPMATTVLSTTTIATTTEEPTIHSLQAESVDISNLFSCKRLRQKALLERRCDGQVDCEDGTDEVGCTCRDHLKHLAPHLICNGELDCRDSTDEQDCHVCPDYKFFCHKSNECIDKEDRCDLEKDCFHSEDEENCYMLVDGEVDLSKINGSLSSRMEGVAVAYSDGSWKQYCTNRNPSSEALRICTHLGFSIASEYKVENGTNNDCQRLHVKCSTPMRRVWAAPLFIAGIPKTIGILINKNWILAPTAGLSFPDSKVFLNAWLGKKNLTLDVDGPTDQLIKVNALKTVGHGETTLLRLETPVNITSQVAPLPFPKWPTPVDASETCELISLTDIGEIFTVDLEPVICSEHRRCYKVPDLPNCDIVGVVVCQSDFGSYPASVVSGDFCNSVSSVIDLPDVTKEVHDADQNSGLFGNLEEDICDSVRCERGDCLEWSRVGDGVSDCYDSRDETDEAWRRREEYCNATGEYCGCRPGEMRCTSSGECISAELFCDGQKDCKDGEDERDCSCVGYLSLTHPELICDGEQNCMDKSDEAWELCSNRAHCLKEQFRCIRSGGCVPKAYACDGEEDCPHGEDEEMCLAISSVPSKPTEGLLLSRLYGELIAQCFLSKDSSLPQNICQAKGNSTSVRYHYANVPYKYVLTDAFSRLALNNMTSVSLRPKGRPFAQVRQDREKLCSALYLECLA